MAKVTNIMIGLLVIVAVVFLFLRKEGFMSPGAMVQLATSHVPTAEDYYYYKNIYPKVIRRDLIDMTGSDPGPIYEPPYLTYP